MSNNQIPVVKFLFKDDLKSLNEALRLAPGYDVEDFGTANDLATYLSTIPACLVIASLKSKDDLVQIASYMKLAKKVAKDCTVKVVVLNFSGDRAYEKAIAKLGILDLVEPSINTKALKFKLDFWMKSLTAQAKLSNKSDSQKVVKSNEQNKQGVEKKPDPTAPVWNPALELEDDIWLIKNEAEVKKILGKWLIRMVGPSPYVGQWVELKPGLWRYDIKESEKEMFVPNEGAWYFTGDQKPDFVWKENNWLITGETFDLFFKDSKQIISRLKSKDKVLNICKNSLYAKTKEQIIIESFDKELVFKKEADKLENLEGEGKTDKSENGNLEGKNKTEQLDYSNLEGKTKTAADKSSNLKGKIENQEAINNQNLEQDANNKREKTYWDGKNTYEQEGKTDLDMKAEKARESKNLDSITETDHQKYYKNHNEAKKFGEAELSEKETAEFEEKQAKDLKGKTSTDDLGPSIYDNSKKSRNRAEKEQQSPDEMSGKSETDKLKSHYGQKDHQNSEKSDRPDELSGKTETDRLKSHYGQKDLEKSERTDRPDEMTGKSETDKIKSHYGKKDSEQRSEGKADKRDSEKGNAHHGKKDQELFGDESEDSSDESNDRKINSERTQKERHSDGKKAVREKKDSDFEEDESSELSGKSHTDKIAGHYGGPKDPTAKERKDKESRDHEEIERMEKRQRENPSHASTSSEKDRNKKDQSHNDFEASDLELAKKIKSASKDRGEPDSAQDMYAREKKSRPEESESQGKDLFDRVASQKNKNPNSSLDTFEDDFNDVSDAEKLTSQTASRKSQTESPKSFDEDNYDLATARKKSDRAGHVVDGKNADILPLRAKTEKARETVKEALNETGLDELTRDSKVISFLVYKDKKIECELNDFFENTIIFLTKEKSIELSSKVQLDLAFKFLEKDKKLKMEGNVMTVDGDGEGNNFVTVQLSKENIAAFDVFMRLYETRQSNVNEFMKKVKGF